MGTQTERNEYVIFGQIVQLIMDRFPELRTRIIKKEDFMTLFLHFNKMQSDITQEIYRNAGFIPKEQVSKEISKIIQPENHLDFYKKPRPPSAAVSMAPSMKLEDLVEKSDIFSVTDDDFLSVLSREDSILTAKSMKQLEDLMNFDVENPLDTQKVQNFILKEKEQSDNLINKNTTQKSTCLAPEEIETQVKPHMPEPKPTAVNNINLSN